FLLFDLLGADSVTVSGNGSDLLGEAETRATELRAEGKTPYVIPVGGSNAIGALGYVDCGDELLGQIEDAGLDVTALVTPLRVGGYAGESASRTARGRQRHAGPRHQCQQVTRRSGAQGRRPRRFGRDVPRPPTGPPCSHGGSGRLLRNRLCSADGRNGRGRATLRPHRGNSPRPRLHRQGRRRADRSRPAG